MAALDLFFFLPLILVLISFLLRQLTGKSNSGTGEYGPRTYPIIGCLPSFYKNRFRLLDWYTELLSESPAQTIVVNRVGAGRIVVTANPENVEYILKTNFPNYPKGKQFTDLIGDLLGCGIFNADGEMWASQRKLASHEFSTRSLKEFVVSVLEEEVRLLLIPLLDKAAHDGSIVDLQKMQVANLQAELSIVQSQLINSRLAVANALETSQHHQNHQQNPIGMLQQHQPAYSNNNSSASIH